MKEGSPGLEARIASELKMLMAGVSVGSDFVVSPAGHFCAALELLIPTLLRRRYPEWVKESLDGFFVVLAQKTGLVTARLAGTCILISDQAVTPFLIELTLSRSNESIESIRVRIGEPGGGPLGISGPECNSREAEHILATVVTRLDSIAWSYEIASVEN